MWKIIILGEVHDNNREEFLEGYEDFKEFILKSEDTVFGWTYKIEVTELNIDNPAHESIETCIYNICMRYHDSFSTLSGAHNGSADIEIYNLDKEPFALSNSLLGLCSGLNMNFIISECESD